MDSIGLPSGLGHWQRRWNDFKFNKGTLVTRCIGTWQQRRLFVCLLLNVQSFVCFLLQSFRPSACLVLSRSKCLLNVPKSKHYRRQYEYMREFVPSRPWYLNNYWFRELGRWTINLDKPQRYGSQLACCQTWNLSKGLHDCNFGGPSIRKVIMHNNC